MPLSPVLDRCMGNPRQIGIRVVYALAEQQHQVTLRLPEGATAELAVRASGFSERFSEIERMPRCAVFGRAVELDYVLRDGDRVEILRPLLVDPKENRRRTAQSARRRLLGR